MIRSLRSMVKPLSSVGHLCGGFRGIRHGTGAFSAGAATRSTASFMSLTLWYLLVEKLSRVGHLGGVSSTNRSAGAGAVRGLFGGRFLETLCSNFGVRRGRSLACTTLGALCLLVG